MTDNEIIKALDSVGTATGVVLGHHSGQADIIADRFRELVDENNRRKADIERLKIDLQSMRNAANSYKMHYETAKSEAIKEFADRLKDEMRLEDDCLYDCMNCLYECKRYVPVIDNLVKEMTGVKGDDNKH